MDIRVTATLFSRIYEEWRSRSAEYCSYGKYSLALKTGYGQPEVIA